VRDPQLSARADQQIRVRQLRRIEIRGEDVLVDVLRLDTALDDPSRDFDQLSPAAVVESDPEVDTGVELGAVLHRVHAAAQLIGSSVASADEADANALL